MSSKDYKYKIGETVWWMDPEKTRSEGYYKIISISKEDYSNKGYKFLLKSENYEIEAYEIDLTPF